MLARVLLVVLFAGAAFAQQINFRLDKRIPLDGVNGRIDHFAVDLPGKRLFVAALGNRTIEVIDAERGTRVRSIGALPEPQGLYYDAGTQRLFAACAGDGSVRVYEGPSFTPKTETPLGSDADNIRFDAAAHQVVVGYGDGALAFLDLSGKLLGKVDLGAHPESFQLEEHGPRIFVNLPDRHEIAVVDRQARKVVERWPVRQAAANFPMALDAEQRRVLIACRRPAEVLIIGTHGEGLDGRVPTVGDADDLFYDSKRKAVYVIGGEGFVDVLPLGGQNVLSSVARVPTAPGARTGRFVPEWNRLFVAVPHHGARKAEILSFALP